jgi:tetratricopeptide (TPR) repeat protein
MRNWILTAIVTVALVGGALTAAGADAKELAAKGYSVLHVVLAGDDAKLPEAIHYMEEARQADGTDMDNLYNLARAYFFEAITLNKEESLVKAERTFARVIELNPKRVDALSFHGSILTQMSGGRDLAKFMQGAQEMKAAIEQSPNDITSRIVMSFTARNFPPQALAAIGNYDPIGDLQFVSNAFDSSSYDFAPHADVVMKAVVGETYKLKGDNQKARKSFEAALKVSRPSDAGQRSGRELLDAKITARMKGGEKSLFSDPLFAGCHSCHLSAPEKLLSKTQ